MKIINKPMIFIGAPRSGTTIISEIIMRHPDIGFISNYNERFPKILNFLRRLLENDFWTISGQKKQLNKVGPLNKFAFKPSESYNFWNYILEKKHDYANDFLLNTTVSNDLNSKINKEILQIIKFQNKKRLAFKNTGPSKLEFFSNLFPNAHIVYIKRNPVHVVESLLKVDFWKKIKQVKIWWKGAYTTEELEKLNVIKVDYEDFAKQPEKTIKTLLEMLELSSNSETCFNYLKKMRIENRNKKDIELISKEELEFINNIFY